MPPRPKRAVVDTGSIDSASLDAALRSTTASTKRAKFDTRNPNKLAADLDEPTADERDIFLEADESTGLSSRRQNRNAVELEGYDTDSSEEGFDETHKKWKREEKAGKSKKEKDDDDEDMFGGSDDEDDAVDNEDNGREGEDAEYRRRKNVKFMNLDEIEGQEMSSRREFTDILDEDQGRGSESDSDDPADEEAVDPELGEGAKKKHAPKLDAFNMKSEMEEGRFDDSGNFIRKAKEADAVHDKWLEGVSRKDMKRAKEAMEQREVEARERMKADDAISTSEVLSTLIGCLERGESILEALARLGGGKKKTTTAKKNSWREKRKAAKEAKAEDGMDMDQAQAQASKGKEPEDPAEQKRKEAVEKITGAADVLLTRGQLEVYDETKESLMRQYKRETGEDWVEPRREESGSEEVAKMWEYRWTDGRDGGEVYGPFGGAEMKSWNEHGFFGEEVEFRVKDGGEWTRVPEFA